MNPSQVRTLDMKLEIVVIPVSNVDRAKQFYGGLGWRLDADFASADGLSRDSVHAAGIRRVGHLRHECHRGGARLRQGTVPDRLRHRGCAQGPAQPRREGQRAVSRRRRRARRCRRAPSVRQCPARRRRIRNAAAISRWPRSAIRTATAGCSRKLPRGFPVVSRVTRPLPRQQNSLPPCGAPPPRMASMRNEPAGMT